MSSTPPVFLNESFSVHLLFLSSVLPYFTTLVFGTSIYLIKSSHCTLPLESHDSLRKLGSDGDLLLKNLFKVVYFHFIKRKYRLVKTKSGLIFVFNFCPVILFMKRRVSHFYSVVPFLSLSVRFGEQILLEGFM